MSTNPFGRVPNLAGAVDLSRVSSSTSTLPDTDDLTKSINLHDSEVNEIAEIMETINAKARAGQVNYSDFDREIKERFEDHGFVVDVVWYHSNVESVKIPEIVVKRRTERREFDHDRQVHEVTNDVLGFGEGGTIKVDKDMFRALEDGSFRADKHGHKH